MSEPTPGAADPQVGLLDNPDDVRKQADALLASAGRIARILNSPATTPDARRRAKDELKALKRDAGALWSLI
jgi:hypothetical protein